MPELTADIVTDLYLYGAVVWPPNSESGMYDEWLIRHESAVAYVSVGLDIHVNEDSGGFANPAFFGIIK